MILSSFGQQLRQVRQQKGFELNEFAKELGVSPVYLNNLETGKTQTIQLEVLSRLQNELYMIIDDDEGIDDQTAIRIDRISSMLHDLYKLNQPAAEYLMAVVEQGIEVIVLRPTDIH
ncbi:MAG: helix-turn-helix domain-containing protein [Bacillota bacterium]